MAFQLMVVKGGNSSQAIRHNSGVMTIGRQEGCQLTVRSSQVSRKHCQLFEKDGKILLKDLGSSNGTFVNGTKVEGLHVLAEGDVLTIGPVEFRVAPAGEGAAVEPGKPGSTAIAEGVPAPVPLSEDDVFDLMIDEPSGSETPAAAAPPKSKKTATVKKVSKKTNPDAPAAAAPPPAPEAGNEADEAIADFLMNIKLEDD